MKRYIRSSSGSYDTFVKYGDTFYLFSCDNFDSVVDEFFRNLDADVSRTPIVRALYPDSGRKILSLQNGWRNSDIERNAFVIYDIPSNREVWGIDDRNIVDLRDE